MPQSSSWIFGGVHGEARVKLLADSSRSHELASKQVSVAIDSGMEIVAKVPCDSGKCTLTETSDRSRTVLLTFLGLLDDVDEQFECRVIHSELLSRSDA